MKDLKKELPKNSGRYGILHDIHTYLIVLLVFLSFFAIHPFSSLLRGVFYGIMLAYSVVFFILNVKQNPPVISIPSILCCVYFVLSTISYMHNGDILTEGFPHFQYLFLALIAFTVRSDDDIENEVGVFAKIITVASICMASLSILFVILIKFIPNFVEFFPHEMKRLLVDSYGDGSRFMGLTGHANRTGGYCAMASGISLLLFANNEKSWKIVSGVNIALSLYIVFFFCASRASMLVMLTLLFCFPLFYYFSWYDKSKKFRKYFGYIFAIFVLAILCCVLAVILSDSFRSYLLNDIIRIKTFRTGSGRTLIWSYMLNASENSRIFGVSKKLIFDKFGYGTMHNMYLELFVINGIPTTIAYFSYFFISIYYLCKMSLAKDMPRKKKNLCIMAFVFFLAVMVQGLFENFLFSIYSTTGFFATYFLATTQVLWKNYKNVE